MTPRPEPLRLYTAIMAGWLVLLGGQAFTSLLPTQVTAFLILGTAAVHAGMGEWARSRVTPVVAPQTMTGHPLVPLELPPIVVKKAAAKKPLARKVPGKP